MYEKLEIERKIENFYHFSKIHQSLSSDHFKGIVIASRPLSSKADIYDSDPCVSVVHKPFIGTLNLISIFYDKFISNLFFVSIQKCFLIQQKKSNSKEGMQKAKKKRNLFFKISKILKKRPPFSVLFYFDIFYHNPKFISLHRLKIDAK